MSKHITYVVAGGLGAVLVIAVALGVRSFGKNLCKDGEFTTVRSPGGKQTATLFVRDCGATTDYATLVQVNGEQVFSVDGYFKDKTSINWATEKKLEIEYSGRPDAVRGKVQKTGDIRIEVIQK